MGRIRTKDVKDLARNMYDVYPEKFSGDFEENKENVKELGVLSGKSKRYRNRVTGYLVRIARIAERKKETTDDVVR